MSESRCVHRWDLTPAEARSLQDTLRDEITKRDNLSRVRYVAGTDVAFEKNKTITRAAVAVLRFPSLELEEFTIARRPTSFPYVPGLLSFREIPAVLDAMEKLAKTPDLLLVDGQGLAHPRRFGLACHLGFLTGLPAIGVAKSRLIGVHDDVPAKKGKWVPLLDNEEIIGAALRTRDGVRPLYVSVGHRISLETAVKYVLRCVTRYRLPETTRWADRLAGGYLPASAKKRGD